MDLDNYYQELKDGLTTSAIVIPNGAYTVSVIDAKLETTTNVYTQLVWSLKIIKGKLKKSVIEHKNTIVSTTGSIKQLIKDISIFGVSINNLTELDDPKLYKQFIGRKLKVKVDQKEISYNTYFLKILE